MILQKGRTKNPSCSAFFTKNLPLAVLFEYLDGKDILSMFVNRIKIMWRTS